eukprot:gnl/MRDRNA2_/MRDRNA2_31172_c0_seq1.p1 gnl/MRDRNA2_/MRDRNA2_31172_c0~~gnl/MRDRNA2_/MRDRNA2_31172_c0_seq1.p1  ORF type:complete len:719 (-),score=148.94 gnl/MRDRNA2_/MRDRNA2_31172_c0_seq1:99-2255(-)
MHGRVKKDILKRTDEEKAKEIEQVRTAFDVFGKLYDQRKNQVYDKQTHKLTTTALQFNPEIATLWNFRREILESGKLEGDMRVHLLGEMKLLEMAIQKSAKVYCIWHHRRWVLERLLAASKSVADMKAVLEKELDLCVKMLSFDERNFHCWNHRAFVISCSLRESAKQSSPSNPALQEGKAQDAIIPAPKEIPDSDLGSPSESAALQDNGQDVGVKSSPSVDDKDSTANMKLPDVEHLDFKLSEDLINRNFSNYSAWHLRALQPPGKIDLETELEWLKQGIYTEPNDQSVWQYHHWLTALQCRSLTITHAAVLDSTLYIFLSGPASLRSDDGAGGFVTLLEPAGAVSKSGTGGYAGAATGSRAAAEGKSPLSGHFVPLEYADSVPGRADLCRPLSNSRRRWALAWRFVPTESSSNDVSGLLTSLKPLTVVAPLQTLENRRDGTSALTEETLVFRGQPVHCDSTDAASLSDGQQEKEMVGGTEVIDKELEMVDELLEIEEDCRWARVARCRLDTMRKAGGGETLESAEARAEAYDELSKLDPLRAKLHSDAAQSCHQEGRTAAWLAAGKFGQALNLSGLGLRCLSAACILRTFGLRVLNVNDNQLGSWGPLLGLLSLVELNASNNRLKGKAQAVFVLKRLQRIDVSGNNLSLNNDTVLPPPERLEMMDLSRNAESCSKPSEVASEQLHWFLGPRENEAKNWEVHMDTVTELLRFQRHPT